jgi:hypothetical protein
VSAMVQARCAQSQIIPHIRTMQFAKSSLDREQGRETPRPAAPIAYPIKLALGYTT